MTTLRCKIGSGNLLMDANGNLHGGLNETASIGEVSASVSTMIFFMTRRVTRRPNPYPGFSQQ